MNELSLLSTIMKAKEWIRYCGSRIVNSEDLTANCELRIVNDSSFFLTVFLSFGDKKSLVLILPRVAEYKSIHKKSKASIEGNGKDIAQKIDCSLRDFSYLFQSDHLLLHIFMTTIIVF